MLVLLFSVSVGLGKASAGIQTVVGLAADEGQVGGCFWCLDCGCIGWFAELWEAHRWGPFI